MLLETGDCDQVFNQGFGWVSGFCIQQSPQYLHDGQGQPQFVDPPPPKQEGGLSYHDHPPRDTTMAVTTSLQHEMTIIYKRILCYIILYVYIYTYIHYILLDIYVVVYTYIL